MIAPEEIHHALLYDTAEGDDVGRKKHKKNKHKKKARSREGESKTRVVEAEPGVRPLTLKIKLGKKPIER